MKKSFVLIAIAVIAIVSCTKTTNNTTVITPLPSFTVNGIHDITIVNGSTYSAYSPITVQYNDSTQQTVTLSLSALPGNITLDSSNWVSTGIPSFSTYLGLYDTTSAGATPGTYPITLTASSGSTRKTYTFNLIVLPHPACTSDLVGKYIYCTNCLVSYYYTDSVYADPTVVNKIWFTNFDNSGYKVYGNINCVSMTIDIPFQAVAGALTYQGSGNVSSHYISVNLLSGSGTCNMRLN